MKDIQGVYTKRHNLVHFSKLLSKNWAWFLLLRLLPEFLTFFRPNQMAFAHHIMLIEECEIFQKKIFGNCVTNNI